MVYGSFKCSQIEWIRIETGHKQQHTRTKYTKKNLTCESSRFLLNGLNFTASLERIGEFSPNNTGTRFAEGPVWIALLS